MWKIKKPALALIYFPNTCQPCANPSLDPVPLKVSSSQILEWPESGVALQALLSALHAYTEYNINGNAADVLEIKH